jgi:chemotaxis protein MotB
MADDKSKQPIIIKKRKGGHAGAHGGAWKIAYADFVTAMMAFFLVMWIVGMAEETKHGIAEYFQNMSARAINLPASPHLIHMGGAPPVRPNLKPLIPRDNNFDKPQAELLGSKIDSLLGSSLQFERLRGTIISQVEDDRMLITFCDTAEASLFTDDGATLKPESRRLFEGIAAVVANYRCRFVIEGHTDGRTAPGLPGKWERSADRAVAIRVALANGAIGDDRIEGLLAFADNRLALQSDPMNPANRRVVIVIPYDLPDAPGQ